MAKQNRLLTTQPGLFESHKYTPTHGAMTCLCCPSCSSCTHPCHRDAAAVLHTGRLITPKHTGSTTRVDLGCQVTHM